MKRYDANLTPEISQAEQTHMDYVRSVASECMVLMENNGVLPLSEPCKVALYGNGARGTVKGGTGSGDVNSRFVVNVEQGLENAGFTITTKDWLDAQEQAAKAEKAAYIHRLEERAEREQVMLISVILDEPFLPTAIAPVTAEALAQDEADTAIYVLARNSGEGADRWNRQGDYRLLDTEKALLTQLGRHYKKVIVLLNIGGIIQMADLFEIEGLDAILHIGQLGNQTGNIVADVLLGKSAPSGKLTDTWAKHYEDYPSSAEFSHNNGDINDEYYKDGVYVGYRYFDTFNVAPFYPFGYGKGYTDFSINCTGVTANEQGVTVQAEVKNIGKTHSGKEVVQVYVSVPSVEVEQPYQTLAGFAKTKLLRPNETDTVEISFPMTSLQSFDEKKSAYVLEKGKYYIRLGNSSRTTAVIAALVLDETAVTKRVKHICPMDCDFERISAKGITPYSYETEQKEKDAAPVFTLCARKIPQISVAYDDLPQPLEQVETDHVITIDDVKNGAYTIEQLVSQLTPEEMADLCVGTDRGKGGSLIGASAKRVPGAAGDTSILLAYRGIRDMVNADGPAGLRLTPHFRTDAEGTVLAGGEMFGDFYNELPEKQEGQIDYYQYCTAVPVATSLACSWNVEMIQKIGDIVGAEMSQFGVRVWLAPAMNIHRNPLCGRNFEYYSEDALLSGLCAAAIVRGVQAYPNTAACIKHYCANNQEDNRMFINVHMHERTLRDIYLRNFAVAIEESKPSTLMTSYNLLNGVHTANSYDLITCYAREENGFDGYILTDWFTSDPIVSREQSKPNPKYDSSSSASCVYAGNDVQMPGAQARIDEILDALHNSALPLASLQQCCVRILSVFVKRFA